MACSILGAAGSVRGRSVFRRPRARDFSVRLRPAIAIELPRIADLLNLLQVQVGHQQFVLIAAGLRHDLSAWIAKITLAIELANVPRLLRANPVDGRNKIRVSDGVRGLLKLPQIFGTAGDRGRRIVDNLRTVEPENACAFGKMPIVTDVYTNARVTCVEDRIPGIARREIELFPEARMAMWDMVFSIFSQVAAVCID